MSAGFAILIHLVAIFIVSFIIAIIGVFTIFIFSKQKKTRKAIFLFTAPFVGFYTLYICGFFCSSIVAEYKKIDMGIGDCWYVPIKNNRQLLFIDVPNLAHIAKEDRMLLISEVSKIQESHNLLYGETFNNKFFTYNTLTDEVKNFNNEKELLRSISVKKLNLVEVDNFYSTRYNELAGSWFIVVGVFSIIISIAVVYVLKMIILI